MSVLVGGLGIEIIGDDIEMRKVVATYWGANPKVEKALVVEVGLPMSYRHFDISRMKTIVEWHIDESKYYSQDLQLESALIVIKRRAERVIGLFGTVETI